MTSLRAGVVGTGYVGVVHVHALRLLGVDVAAVVGASPERAAAPVAAGGPPGAAPDYPTFGDGHRANALGDAIALSDAERRWAEVHG